MFNRNIDITSANATGVLTVDSLYPAGVALENFGTDQSLALADVQMAETRMGVDGRMVAGMTPSIKQLTLTVEPVSPTLVVLDQLIKAMDQTRRIYLCGIVFIVPSIAKVFNYSVGVLQTAKPMPDPKKVLDPQNFIFHFERLTVQGL